MIEMNKVYLGTLQCLRVIFHQTVTKELYQFFAYPIVYSILCPLITFSARVERGLLHILGHTHSLPLPRAVAVVFPSLGSEGTSCLMQNSWTLLTSGQEFCSSLANPTLSSAETCTLDIEMLPLAGTVVGGLSA
jgi:hypothetical protein